MKPIVAFFLACWILGGSLLPGFGIDQSAHLGDLMEHYQEHKKLDAHLSFVKFLSMHYGADSAHQKRPNHSHRNLPAHSHSVTSYLPTGLLLAVPGIHQLGYQMKATFFWKADLYAFLAVFALINPPQY
ncbi:hypothetical protein CLV58_103215 [Spirosoma oryzae]|uniref:Uncharacterized protein n=1 Tax=Spirosoma oryzae TaxID=1469603 RepID=A0A2T0TEZ8_9BACT|nr:hypothetical protein [Spirosoma oryzae]PRY44246.1 hypothetical protein CLV58_103215 [Spirosoma oryzae]